MGSRQCPSPGIWTDVPQMNFEMDSSWTCYCCLCMARLLLMNVYLHLSVIVVDSRCCVEAMDGLCWQGLDSLQGELPVRFQVRCWPDLALQRCGPRAAQCPSNCWVWTSFWQDVKRDCHSCSVRLFWSIPAVCCTCTAHASSTLRRVLVPRCPSLSPIDALVFTLGIIHSIYFKVHDIVLVVCRIWAIW